MNPVLSFLLVAYKSHCVPFFGRVQALSTCAVRLLPELRCAYDLVGRVEWDIRNFLHAYAYSWCLSLDILIL